jgi:hypothetical protein
MSELQMHPLIELQRAISEEARVGITPPPPDVFDEEKYPYGVAPGGNKIGIEICAICGKPPTDLTRTKHGNRLSQAFLFSDKLSAEEYRISGICQSCQDSTFTPPKEDTTGHKLEFKAEKCIECKFWSDKIARSIGLNPIEALCLNDKSPNHMKYMTEKDFCEFGVMGLAIDRDA